MVADNKNFLVMALALAMTACAGEDRGTQGAAADDGGGGDADFGGSGGGDDDGIGDGDEGGWGTGGDGADGADDGGPDATPPEEPEPEEQMPPDECVADQDVTLFLSPDDSNSMSSPVQARESILGDFSSIGAVAIRTWEFLNYYTFDYEPPSADAGVAVYTDLLRLEEEDGAYVMQIGVASPEVTAADRDPIAITLVLDTSGSMQGQSMDMLKETCRAIAASLKEGDKVSMVTWNTSNNTVLGGYAVSGPDDATVVGHCDALEASGGTDLHAGLTRGYALAQEVFQPEIINRIVLVSDGGANAGVTDVELIAEHAGDSGADGIYMVGVGVGDARAYNDDLMDIVTDAGKGASVFIHDTEEAWKIFNRQFVSTLGVAARDVQVRLDMPPGFEVVRFSGEEISEDPSEVEPQHLAPSDTMVFHQQLRTCAPELVTDETEFTVTVSYLDAKTFEQVEVSETVSFARFDETDHRLLRKGAAIFEYAEGLKALRAGDPDPLRAAKEALAAAQADNPDDADLAEIATVLDAAEP